MDKEALILILILAVLLFSPHYSVTFREIYEKKVNTG